MLFRRDSYSKWLNPNSHSENNCERHVTRAKEEYRRIKRIADTRKVTSWH
jgi:hypothetical protein